MQQESEAYREARRRVKSKAGFYKHLYVFVGMNLFFIMLKILNGHGVPFFPGVAFWGLGLAFHYLKVFGIPGTGVLSRDWEERELNKEINRMGRQSPQKEELQESLTLKELRKNYKDSDLV